MRSSLRGTHIVYVINVVLLFTLIKILFFRHKRQDDKSNVPIIKQVRLSKLAVQCKNLFHSRNFSFVFSLSPCVLTD